MSKNSAAAPRASSARVNVAPRSSTPNRVLMINMEDATDDEAMSSGASTPTSFTKTLAGLSILTQTSVAPGLVMLPAVPSEPITPSVMGHVPPPPSSPNSSRLFVSAVAIPYGRQTGNGSSLHSGISSNQRMYLEEANVYHPDMTRDVRESLAKNLEMTYDQVTQWLMDHGQADTTIEHPNNHERIRTTAASLQERISEPVKITKTLDSSTPGTVITSTNKRQLEPEHEDSGEDGVLGSSTLWHHKLATPNKVSRPRAADTTPSHVLNNKLRSADVTRQLSSILRGGAIVQEENVKQLSSIMTMTSESAGKKPILNAILNTKFSVVLKAFIQSSGLRTMQTWLQEAMEDLESNTNKELVMQCLRILSSLPFSRSEDLLNTSFGRIVKRLSNRITDTPGDKVGIMATELVEKWDRMTEGTQSSTPKPVLNSRSGSNNHSKASGVSGTPASRLHGFTDLSALPSFNKIKSSASAGIEKRKSNISANTNFFQEIAPNVSPKSRPLAIRTGGKPTFESKKTVDGSSSPRSPTTNGRTKRGRDEDITKDGRPSEPSRPIVLQMTMPVLSGGLLPMTLATPATATPKEKSNEKTNEKPKKTVRFKAGDELEEIREIESRQDRPMEDWVAEMSDSDTEWDSGDDVDLNGVYQQDNSNMSFGLRIDLEPPQETPRRPAFLMPESEIATLVRGDSWFHPPLVSLAGVDVVPRRIVSSELDSEEAVQEESVPQLLSGPPRVIQWTPLEPPTTPLSPTTEQLSVPIVPLFEADTVDHAPELRQALNVILQFLEPPPPYNGLLEAQPYQHQQHQQQQQKYQQEQFKQYRDPQSQPPSSLIALAAELAKHDEKFQRIKGTGGGIKAPRSVKKPTVWQRHNPGLVNRIKKNDVSHKSEDPEGEAARQKALERKAKMYERLKRGEEVPDRIREELLVEFEYGYKGRGRRRGRRDSSGTDSQSDYSDQSRSQSRSRSRSRDGQDWDRDESRALARDPRDYKDDPWVEHEDEFGRTRLVRKSEVPKPAAAQPPDHRQAQGIHNPLNPFPVFQNPDAVEKQEWIRDATGEMKNMGTFGSRVNSQGQRHYDNTTERRARGVGFYAFSQDEDERQRQMRELLEMRSQTERKIAQHKSLRDKRRDEIAERKRLIAQKRLKSLASTIVSNV
ncbi:hypothetical protein BGZ83_005952 [Gryganskiella cystojenkinii]|nr:hypothetical protein BGZ83_005952 [Gryganskiella cystojenkinii]